MAEEFEIHKRTCQRVLAHFRDRLQAPLAYCKMNQGYYYTDPNYCLPLTQISQEEILSLILAKNVLAKSSGGFISRYMHSVCKKLITHADTLGLSSEKIEKSFSAFWNKYIPLDPHIFEISSSALLEDKLLSFKYCSASKNNTSQRTVEPHHLQNYMGSWILLAFCKDRQDWRKFALTRISQIQKLKQSFTPRPADEWKHLLDVNYGIFQSGESVKVRFCIQK